MHASSVYWFKYVEFSFYSKANLKMLNVSAHNER